MSSAEGVLPVLAEAKPTSGELHQLRDGGQVPVRVLRLNMPGVGGQHWQQGRDVRALAVPVDEGVHGKAVSQAMNARVDGVGADSRQPGDHPEDLVSLSPPQGPPGDGHEEPIDPRGGAEPVPRGGVGTEGSGDRRVQGDKAYPAGASRAGR
jgi:hypothetical protein